MKRLLGTTFSIFFVIAIFAIPEAHAINCDGQGTFLDFAFVPTELNPASSITASARFQYKTLSQDFIECYQSPVTITFYIIDSSGNRLQTLEAKDMGTISPGQTVTATIGISHSTIYNQGNTDRKVRVNASATHPTLSGGDILANTTGEFMFKATLSKTFACIAGDGKYSCGTKSDCADATGCSGKQCIVLSDSRQCGQSASANPAGGSGGGSGGGTPSKTVSFDFSIKNPLAAKDLTELINVISQWLFNIAIPIAVIMIIWGGVRFLWARGDSGEVEEAKKILKYAIIGLAIIFIGKGFVSLVQSVLELGGSSPTTQQPGSGSGGTVPGTGGGAGSGPAGPTVGGNGREGNACSVNTDCASGYICHLNICQFPDGNTLGDRCNGNGNCAKDMWCNNRDPDALRVIDGQTLGLCALPGGDHYPCVSDSECAGGSFCDTSGYGCKSKRL